MTFDRCDWAAPRVDSASDSRNRVKRCPYEIASAARDRAPAEEFGRPTGNLRMRPFTDRVEVPILNWGLEGGSDPRANKYPRPTGGLRQSVY
ncbi:hypothetical protein Taro_055695 [Colocasia esculenta]|uniref:Uncharacterized protein n=1 Tax=Colocasia esculenta TaxID=4460 RepID=A0A843XS24_COLES|nr:hypothetical protein [Colocasia esculenta]